jgi:tryptophanyl-tRNA synthetase
MSKSHPDKRGKIDITDTPDDIVEKVKKAVTDCTSQITYDPDNRPGVSTLLTMHSLISGLSPEEICEENKLLDTGR